MTARPALVAWMLGILSGWPSDLRAAAIFVPAGGSIQAAIDAASPGDTILLEPGAYPGAIVIDKSLRIAGRGVAYIDAQGAAVGIDIAADDVSIGVRRLAAVALFLTGTCPTEAAIRVTGRRGITIRNVGTNTSLCDGPAHPVGIDVTDVTDVRFRNVTGEGDQIGMRLRQLVLGAGVKLVRIVGSASGDPNVAGILLEDIAPGAALARSGLRLIRGSYFSNFGEFAVRLVDADGVLMSREHIGGSIDIDATSDNNFIRGFTVLNGVANDAGSGNCFRNNENIPNNCSLP